MEKKKNEEMASCTLILDAYFEPKSLRLQFLMKILTLLSKETLDYLKVIEEDCVHLFFSQYLPRMHISETHDESCEFKVQTICMQQHFFLRDEENWGLVSLIPSCDFRR